MRVREVVWRAELTKALWATRRIHAAGTSGIRPARAFTRNRMKTSWQMSSAASSSRVSDRAYRSSPG